MSATPIYNQVLASAPGVARRARRQRTRLLSLRYDRARDLPRLISSSILVDRPHHPFCKLVGTWLLDTPETTRGVMQVIATYLRQALQQRDRRDMELRIDALRIALYAEARRYFSQRARALFGQAAE